MKIAVLNGSPKGDTSVTMQYIHYMRQLHPDIVLTVHNISHRIKALEKDPKAFRAVLDDVRSSDLVIWAFPLYYFLVPSQYKRFIEMVFEGKAASAFKSKFAAVLTTSLHFFDHTAHNYMRAICDDLGMKAISDRYPSDFVARQGLQAGLDLFLHCGPSAGADGLVEALVWEAAKPAARDRVRESVGRVLTLRKRLADPLRG